MSRVKQPSALQLAILQAIWKLGEATVGDVHAALHGERRLAPTTVATLLSRLERQGLVSHRTEGRQFVYRARVSEDAVRTSMVSELTNRLFGGDVTALVSHLLGARDIKKGDLARVKALIDARTRIGRSRDAR